jgi:hypothetical protein
MTIPDVRIMANQEFSVYGKLMNVSVKFGWNIICMFRIAIKVLSSTQILQQ